MPPAASSLASAQGSRPARVCSGCGKTRALGRGGRGRLVRLGGIQAGRERSCTTSVNVPTCRRLVRARTTKVKQAEPGERGEEAGAVERRQGQCRGAGTVQSAWARVHCRVRGPGYSAGCLGPGTVQGAWARVQCRVCGPRYNVGCLGPGTVQGAWARVRCRVSGPSQPCTRGRSLCARGTGTWRPTAARRSSACSRSAGRRSWNPAVQYGNDVPS